MIPDELGEGARAKLLDASIMGPPIVWLASAAAAGVHDERIVAREFDGWLAARGATDEDLGRRAWHAMSELALDHDRKVAVSQALGLSWVRVLALRRLTAEPHTLRALAERLAADPPYVTVIVDDLEARGLVSRTAHPLDRRAKVVELTAAGRAVAGRADAIRDEPPAALHDVPADDLAGLVRVVERVGR